MLEFEWVKVLYGEVVMGTTGVQGFDKTKQVWQLKWPPAR